MEELSLLETIILALTTRLLVDLPPNNPLLFSSVEISHIQDNKSANTSIPIDLTLVSTNLATNQFIPFTKNDQDQPT